MTKLKIKASGLTDVGRKRDHNEDNILLSEDLGLFAVADGMGGHAAGEVASKLAVSKMQEFVRRIEEDDLFAQEQTAQEGLSAGENILHMAISFANRELCTLSEENVAYFGMGTTIAAVYLNNEKIHIAHVGDSRVYQYHNGVFQTLTQDHSWVNEQLQKNILTEEEARNHRWRNVITRALGNRQDVEIDLKTVPARAGDCFLICSDGLTSMVEDAAILQSIQASDGDLEKTCADLVRLANEAGGHDNVSIVMIRIESAGDSPSETTQPLPTPVEESTSEATQP